MFKRVPTFIKINETWNAEPNAPEAQVMVSADQVTLQFLLNSFAYKAEDGELGILTFTRVGMWRIGATNDEGWYRGQCRYSQIAPAWGDLYELIGEDPFQNVPIDWQFPDVPGNGTRHFLFYLRDETFECLAADYEFKRMLSAT